MVMHFYLLFSTLLMMVTSEGTNVAVITSSLEEDVTLKCLDSHEQYQEKCYRGRWIKYDNGQEEIILPETTKAQQDRWINWTPAEDGHMSLRLRKLKKSDEGLYRCEIWRDWTCVYVKNVTLKLRECKSEGVVNALFGSPVKLICPFNNSPRENRSDISWFQLKAGNPEPLQSNRAEEEGFSLVFQSVDASDKNWYRCEYSLGGTQRCFEFNLQTKETTSTESTIKPSQQAEKAGGTMAVVAPLLTMAVGLAVLTGLLVCRRRVHQRLTPEGHQPDSVSHSPCDYESIDFHPTEVNVVQGGGVTHASSQVGTGIVVDVPSQEESGFTGVQECDPLYDQCLEANACDQ